MGQQSTAVVFEAPGELSLRAVGLPDIDAGDCLVEVSHSGISTGTERLLWAGTMPPFPGLRYPLVPGYESIGRVLEAHPDCQVEPGQLVFIPGSRGFTDVAGLFGGAASHLVVPGSRLVPLPANANESAVLLALIATAIHAIHRCGSANLPDLVIGNGTLGRLIMRIAKAMGASSINLWEADPQRIDAGAGPVYTAQTDTRRDYSTVIDVSGDANIINQAVDHMAPGSTLVLAGFYHQPLSFDFAPAFMREVTLCIAAEWQAADMSVATALLAEGRIALDDLITHTFQASDAASAYREAFNNPLCLKSVLDWSAL